MGHSGTRGASYLSATLPVRSTERGTIIIHSLVITRFHESDVCIVVSLSWPNHCASRAAVTRSFVACNMQHTCMNGRLDTVNGVPSFSTPVHLRIRRQGATRERGAALAEYVWMQGAAGTCSSSRKDQMPLQLPLGF